MTEYPDRPSGAKLDQLVLWAMGHMAEGPRYSSDIQFFVAMKCGRHWEHDDINFGHAIQRSLERLTKAGLVVTDDGWHFAPDEKGDRVA